MEKFISSLSFSYFVFRDGILGVFLTILKKLNQNNILLFSVFIFLSNQVTFQNANSQTIEWQRCLGGSENDFGTSIQQTYDGGFIVAGSTFSDDGNVSGNHGNFDFWVIKLNSVGNIEWQKCYGGSNIEMANSICQTNDGGYIVAGKAKSWDGDVSGLHGTGFMDYWVVKLSSTGTIEWQKCLGGTYEDWANSIEQTSDGGYIVAGMALSINGDVRGNNGNYDYWVVKLSSTGNIEWQKCLGGSDNDNANSIKQTSDGGYIVAGSTNSNDDDVNCFQGAGDAWIVKLTSLGSIQWQRCLGGTKEDVPFSIEQTRDGGYIVAGYTSSNDGDVSGFHGGFSDAWVVKLSSSGTIEWQKCLGGSSDDLANSIQQTSDGGHIVAGHTYSNDGDVWGFHGGVSDLWLVKLSSTGTIEWQKCLGGTNWDEANSIRQTIDRGYIIVGRTKSNDGDVSGNHGAVDYWVVKLTATSSIDNNFLSDNYIQVIPNPATTLINIQLKGEFSNSDPNSNQNSELNLFISDLFGREILSYQIKFQDYVFISDDEIKIKVDISTLPDGIYSILIKNYHNNIIYWNKMIKLL
ncbi:MAG: T9SS type A sorting domain-containing protein [Ignavibacteria bacterium]|nr:T9SS type A sorting domain-containing protein [Ignavibacteria bacterium]